jgi:hypothetical protein
MWIEGQPPQCPVGLCLSSKPYCPTMYIYAHWQHECVCVFVFVIFDPLTKSAYNFIKPLLYVLSERKQTTTKAPSEERSKSTITFDVVCANCVSFRFFWIKTLTSVIFAKFSARSNDLHFAKFDVTMHLDKLNM